MKTVLSLALCLGYGLMGCSISLTEQLRTQAAFDFNCPAERLTIRNLAGPPITLNPPETAVQAVEGCGKRASYVFDGRRGWLKNSPEPDK
jgi:hypothetical protein